MPDDPYEAAVDAQIASGANTAQRYISDNPEDGVRAMRLSQLTGVPPLAVYSNLDEFDQQTKSQMAGSILRQNRELANFIAENELAPVMANDDYGALDTLSRGAGQSASFMDKVKEAWRGPQPLLPGELARKSAAETFTEGFGDQPLGKSVVGDPFFKGHPVVADMVSKALLPVELTGRLMSGFASTFLEGVGEGAEEMHYAVRGDPAAASQFGNTIRALAEYEMNRGDMGAHVPEATYQAGVVARARTAYRAGRQWLDAGVEPPVGVHPLFDERKAIVNGRMLQDLNQDLANAMNSAMRERSPELVSDLLEKHFGNAELEVSADRAVALYADREPSPDDGLLGWVPNIDTKLKMAREGGIDVAIPMKDWIAKVDPALATDLNNDIRMYPGGITVNESALPAGIIQDTVEAAASGGVPPLYKQVIDAPLPAIRSAESMEPLFSVGDRKLQLSREPSVIDRMAQKRAEAEGLDWDQLSQRDRASYIDWASENQASWAIGKHEFSLVDQNGANIGSLELKERQGGKDLWVEMIGGEGGYGVGNFGPSLILDLRRQLKQEFPNAETISGYRISGARERFGTEREITIRLDAPPAEVAEAFRGVLEGGEWVAFHPTVEGYARVKPEAGPVIDAVRDEMARILPRGVDVQPVGSLKGRFPGRSDQQLNAVYLGSGRRSVQSLILLAMDGADPLGTFRHEAIHHLRATNLLTKAEWNVLEQGARSGKWMDHFDIEGRYPTLGESARLEEAIADGYKTWERQGGFADQPQLHAILQKIKDFFDAIRQKINEVLGRPGTVDDIFQRISSGEVGRRKGGIGDRIEPKFEVPETQGPDIPSYKEILDRLKANATGLDIKSYRELMKLYDQRYAEDLAAANKRTIAEQKQQQTQKWWKDYAEARLQVEGKLRGRPDIAADLFFSAGDFFGRKIDAKVRIASGDLTDAQKAALPVNFYAKNGLPLDSLSTMFGFTNGDAMVNALANMKAQRGQMSALEHFGRTVAAETDKVMASRYGNLDENIFREAKDQALSEVDENVLAQEMYAVAAMAGQRPMDLAFIKETVQAELAKLPIGTISSERFRARMGRHGQIAERALINGDYNEALVSLQNKTYSGILAIEAMKAEKALAKTEKILDKYSKTIVKNVDPEYVNYIHQIMDRIGRSSRRPIEDVLKDIAARGTGTLEEFVNWKTLQQRVIPASPELLDPNWRPKSFDDLTVGQHQDISDMLRAMDWNGRNELKLTKAGDAREFNALREIMLDQLREAKARWGDVEGMPMGTGRLAARRRRVLAIHLQLETIFNHWDKYDPDGVFNQYVMRDLVESANQVDAWKKEYAKKLLDLDDGVDTRKLIQNDIFRDPRPAPPGEGPAPLWVMNRGHLRAAMLNVGTKSNLDKLAYGYRLKPEQIMEWIHQNAKKEDWDFVQKLWDGIFKDIKKKVDDMYRSLTGGVAPLDVPAKPITTRIMDANGQPLVYAGGYYPVIYHRIYEGSSKRLMGRDPLEQPGYFTAMTPSGYTKERTGYVAPIELNLDFMPGRIGQMLHDTGMRPAIINASKVFYDKRIRDTIALHYGPEYKDLLIPYLQSIANSSNYMTRAAQEFTNLSELLRQNMITTLVGLNPHTVGKHFFTALYQSAQEVGPMRFLKAMKDIYTLNDPTGDSIKEFIRKNSLEIQRRDRNWLETLGGATDQLVPKKYTKIGGLEIQGLETLRAEIIRLASKPVAWSDMFSARPTWYAAYTKAMEEGRSHGDAAYLADRAVRRAHGSTAITNRPEIMRIGNPWFTSVYNFFNHIMNRQAEMVWQAGEARGIWKAGDKAEALAQVPKLTSQLAAYVLFPALVEYAFTQELHKKDASTLSIATQALALDLSASWIGLRDAANFMLLGGEPSAGLISTAMREVGNVYRDSFKKDPIGRQHAGLYLQHVMGLIGLGTGMMPAPIGRAAHFLYDVNTGQQRPKSMYDWWEGLQYGAMEDKRWR